LADKWLTDRSSVNPDGVQSILEVAAHYGDRALFDRYLAEAQKTSDPRERRMLLGALANFHDPQLVGAALDLLLSKDFDIRESMWMLRAMRSDPEASAIAYDFLTRNFEALTARMPRDTAVYLIYSGTVFCDEQRLQKVRQFFGPLAPKFTGGPKILDNVLEEIHLCSALRRAQQPSLTQFLKGY